MKNDAVVTVVLKESIRSRGFLKSTEITIISMRKPVVRDLIGLDFTGSAVIESMATLVSRISGVPKESILEMSATDWMEVSTAAGKLMEKK